MPKLKGIRKVGQDIYTINFANYLPTVLKHDPKVRALAEAVTKEALTVSGEIENVLIYARIDELPEELIDILAYDMHVDWYDYSYPLKVKRDILKGSVKVHKKMGTKYAVENTLNKIYGNTKIAEWFEYGGRPYCFRVVFIIEGYACDVLELVKTIREQKRCAAHLDAVIYEYTTRGQTAVKSYARFGESIKVKPKTTKEINSNASLEVNAAVFERNKLKIKPYTEKSIETETKIKADMALVKNDSIYVSAKGR